MRTRHIIVATMAAILAVALVGYAETNANIGVITVGPVETPLLLTPRVRVANDRPEPVDVWFVLAGADELERLGSVPARGTKTFAVPETVATIQVVVQPQMTRGAPYVTNHITVDSKTDVSLQVGRDLGRTTVEVGELEFTGRR